MTLSDADEALLNDLVEDSLDAEAAARVQARLQVEPALAERYRRLRALHDGLRALPPVQVPAGFEQRAVAAAERAHEGAWWRSFRWPLRVAMVAAAGVLVMNVAEMRRDQAPRGVSAAGMAPGASVVNVTLRVRAPAAFWDELASALPGLPRPAVEANAGAPSVFRAEAASTGTSARDAIARLQARIPVEVEGVVPSGDEPVRVHVVLVEP